MNIQHKLFASLLLLSLALIAVFFGLIQWGMDRGVLEYLNRREAEKQQQLLDKLAKAYDFHGGWEAFRAQPQLWQSMLRGNKLGVDIGWPPPPPRAGGGRRPPRPGPGEGKGPGLRPGPGRLPQPIGLLDIDGRRLLGRPPPTEQALRLPIELRGQTVGWLAIPGHDRLTDDFDIEFLQTQKSWLLGVSALIALIAACVSFPLARHLVGPIRQLTRAADQLARGDYSIELPSTRRDELGQLAADVNQLARTLEANQKARQRWVADISHELRTPVAILLGEIEAVIDGVRRADAEQLNSLRQEALHLRKLIDDLHDLSAADVGALSYRKETLDLAELLEEAVERHSAGFARAGLALRLSPDLPEALCWGDAGRLAQLFDNLLSNSAKYTDAGGAAELALSDAGRHWQITLEDSAPGVSDEGLQRLFDYLYREEASRNRRSGGSGLGLAICQRIAEAHDGELTAYHAPQGGLGMRLTLPKEAHKAA